MAKKARFGDWTKGDVRETTTFNVSYSLRFTDGKKTSGKVQVICETREQAGRRVQRMLRRNPRVEGITVKQIWEVGKTPGGLYLPPGIEFIDDEVDGKHKKPL